MIALYKAEVCICLIDIEIGEEITASTIILKWYFQNHTTLMAAAFQEKLKW